MSAEAETPTQDAEELKTIFMYRMWDKQKIRWKFEVNKDMVIVREGPADPSMRNLLPTGLMGLPPIGTNRPINARPTPEERAAHQAEHAKEARERHMRSLAARGIKYEQLENGSILIKEVPEKEKQIMQFFDMKAECPHVQGMQAIRDAYKTEFEAMGGTACPSCQLNGLMRKYRGILESTILK